MCPSLSFAAALQEPIFEIEMDTILLKEVLAEMDKGEYFDLDWVTDDVKRNKGGEWVSAKDVMKTEFVTKAEQRLISRATPRPEVTKNPNHYENSTRNIVFKNGQVRTVAIRLMRRFNGKKIL